MIKTTSEWLRSEKSIAQIEGPMYDPITDSNQIWIRRKRAVMADGFSISIQAGFGLYSIPRETSEVYEAVELGFPSEIDELIEDYSEEPGETETVYGYVPVEIVDQLITKHCGIVNG